MVGTAPNDTLPGVTVMVKGTTTGVTTDVHGKFSIVIPDGDDVVLRFTFIGKKMAEVHYKGQEFLTVKMEDDAQELEEVVINAGYQQIDKRKLTSAVTTLKKGACRVWYLCRTQDRWVPPRGCVSAVRPPCWVPKSRCGWWTVSSRRIR